MNKKALDTSLRYLDSWLEYRSKRVMLPGFVVAVAHKGTVVFDKGYGLADIEHKRAMAPDSIFRIASHSKTFTATALMKLQEQGKLRIDDYVVDYLPWLKDHADRRWRKVTLRQVMSHGAGIIRDGENADYWHLERPFPDREELKRTILDARLVLDNNVKLKYSNYGYSLLGLVIEAISGQPYAEFVEAAIIKPLGLKDTGADYDPKTGPHAVNGYSRREADGTRLPIAPVSTNAMASATGFYSTAADLCAYFSAHMVGSKKLLGDESKKEMQRVHYHAFESSEDYGLGMEIVPLKAGARLGHGGGFPGQTTLSRFRPKDGLVVIVLTNCLDSPVGSIMDGVFGVLDCFQKNAALTKPEVEKLAGRYANLWSTIDFIAAGNTLSFVYPDGWNPLDDAEKLKRVDAMTFRIDETNSFGSEGEPVRFAVKNGAVESVKFGGYTLWPEKVWDERQRSRSIVELPS